MNDPNPKTIEPETPALSKVAVYLRVSTAQQDTESQRHRISAYLLGKGLSANHWYEDVMSGKTPVRSRPAFIELQSAIFDGRVNHVVCFAVDRFARNMVDGLVQIDEWQKMHVRLTFVADMLEVELGTWMGDVLVKLAIGMKLAFAEHELERRAHRVKNGMQALKVKVQLARQMQCEGRSLEFIAGHFGWPLKRTAKALEGKQHHGGPKPKINVERMQYLFHQGWAISEVATIMHVSERRIYQWRAKLGMTGTQRKVIPNRKQVMAGLIRGNDIAEAARNGKAIACPSTPSAIF